MMPSAHTHALLAAPRWRAVSTAAGVRGAMAVRRMSAWGFDAVGAVPLVCGRALRGARPRCVCEREAARVAPCVAHGHC